MAEDGITQVKKGMGEKVNGLCITAHNVRSISVTKHLIHTIFCSLLLRGRIEGRGNIDIKNVFSVAFLRTINKGLLIFIT